MTEEPVTFESMLDEHQALEASLSVDKARELELRKALFNAAFPNPKEGTNTYELADGRLFKGTHKISRSVDMAEVPALQNDMAEQGLAIEDYFPVKRSVATGAYKGAGDNIKKLLDRAIIAKPGTPAIKVE